MLAEKPFATSREEYVINILNPNKKAANAPLQIPVPGSGIAIKTAPKISKINPNIMIL